MHNRSCENDFIYMRMKNRYHIKGWPLNLFLIQRPKGLGNSLLWWVLHCLFFSETRLHQQDLIPSTKGTRDSVITAHQKKALNLNTPQDPRIIRNRFFLSHYNSFSTDDDGGDSENVTLKMNSRFFKLFRVYANSLEMSKVGEFPWSWFLGDRTKV